MKTTLEKAMLTGAALLLLTACSAVTPAKMARIHPAMKPAEVEAILGRPAYIVHSQSETTDISGEADYYPTPNGQGRVIFVNNSVFKADFVPGATKS